ncbi:MAG TPA: AsmA family protein [Burkholderiales bacterium]|nr:AsmA family protein [Burkholderiales bacterium]
MKALKYAGLALAALVLLVIAGVVVFAMTFDPNKYKGQIAAAVKDKTGRVLKLEGDLKVAIFPSLGADLAKVSLSERDPAQEFLSLDAAHVSVALLPLLHGEVIVDRVRVSGLKARVVKGKDGKFNFDDLVQAGPEKPAEKKAPAPEEGADKQAVKFDIAGVSVDRSSISYQDLKTGQELALSDVKLATGRVAQKADGKLEFAASVKGAKPAIDLRASLSGGYKVDLPAKSYELSKLDFAVKGSFDKDTLDVKLSVPSLAPSGKTFSVQALTAELALSGPGMPKAFKVSTSGSVKGDLEKEVIDADLVSKIDESTIKSKLAMANFSAPAYTFDVDIDRLNLDRYFPPKPKGGSASAGASDGKGDGEAKAEDTPLDLSALKTLNASGKLQCGALQVKGLKLANLKTEVKAANGRLDSPHSANLYDGAVTGAIGLNAEGNHVSLKETMTNVSVGPLLRDAAQQDRLEGRGNVNLDVSGAGATVNTLKKSLGGSAKVNLRDGAIKGVDLGAIVSKVKSLAGKSEEGSANSQDQTKFTELNASFAIKNGVAHNQDLDIKAPLIRVSGAGDIDIGASSINYVVKPTLVATTKGQGGKEAEQLSGITVPVKLTGPLDGMKYQVDYSAAASELAKSKVGEKAKEAIDKNKDKVEEQVRDRLKGLLNR